MRDDGEGGADVMFFGEVALSSGEVMMPGVVCEGDADVTFTRDATVLNKR